MTGEALTDGLLQGSTWDVSASAGQITYRTFDSLYGYWHSYRETAIDRAFDAYESVIDVDFVDLGRTGVSHSNSDGLSAAYFHNSADISIAIYDLYSVFGWGVAGIGLFPDQSYASSTWSSAPGDVLLDYRSAYSSLLGTGDFGLSLMLHELGHAMGLKHPHDDGGAGRQTFGQLGLQAYDNDHHTVMSYNSNSASLYSGHAATLMPLDIRTLQALYGANTSTNSGDTAYAIVDNGALQTIWDAGGTDLLNFAGVSAPGGLFIDMTPGAITLIGSATGWALAYDMVIENVIGTAGADVIVGNAADNRMDGGAGDDTLRGGLGDDRLLHGGGADRFDGGPGVDWADYSAAGSVAVDLQWGGGVLGWGGAVYGDGASGDLYIGIENVLGSVFADSLTGDGAANRLEGDAGDDALNGRAGADHLIGGLGDDILIGGAGADRLDGGLGFDVADYAGAGSAVAVDLIWGGGPFGAGGALYGGSEAVGDLFTAVEGLVGSRFADSLTGSDAADRLDGGAGDDVLNGRAGDDALIGGLGGDRLIGGAGTDAADYSGVGSAVAVDLIWGGGGFGWNGPVYGGSEAVGDLYVGVETVIGSAHSDSLTGDDADNLLEGRGGADVLNGRDGADLLIGGAGGDLLIGGAGADSVSYADAGSAVSVDLIWGGGGFGWNGPVYGGSEAVGDLYVGVETVIGSAHSDSLTGDDADNGLQGGAGDDALNGRAGADSLTGGRGDDLLMGGAGADLFDFRGTFDADTVLDFEAGAGLGDRAWLEGGVFADFGAVQAAMADVGGGVQLTVGGYGTVEFRGLSLTSFHADDFLLA